MNAVLQKLTKNMLNKNSSFLTLIAGEDVSEEDANAIFETISEKLPKSVEASLVMGGQPVYYYIVSVE